VSLFRIISAQKANFPVSVVCDVLDVNRSSLYAWERQSPSGRALSDVWLTERIKEIWESNRRVYVRGACIPNFASDAGFASVASAWSGSCERPDLRAGPSRRRGTTVRVPGVRVA
jgi:putative transposase